MPEVVFHTRAEDQPRIGSGHLQRSVRLARYLQEHGFECSMLVKRTALADRLLADEALPVAYWDEYDYRELAHTDIVVVDDYRPSERLLRRIAANHPRHAVVGFDVTRLFDYYDETINPITPHGRAGHAGLALSLHQVGPRVDPRVSPGVGRVFLSFGNYDHRDLVRRSVAIVDECFEGVEVTVFPDTEVALRNNSLVRGLGFREALLGSEVAIVSGGLTVFDAVYAGVPSIVWCQYRHQIHNASLFGDCVINAGLTNSPGKIAGHLKTLATSQECRQRMRDCCFDKLDDRGYERVGSIMSSVATGGAGH